MLAFSGFGVRLSLPSDSRLTGPGPPVTLPLPFLLSLMLRFRAPCVVLAGLVTFVIGPERAEGQATDDRPMIRAVVVDRGEVFDSLEARQFWGFRLVNALHAETRPYVIRRELLFRAGERFDTARVNESARNLRALSIFRDVRIDTISADSGVTVRVRTTDGWTTNAGFGIRTSGSERVINVFLQEINLFGTRTVATLGYEDDPDRSSAIVGFDTPRLIANRVGAGASYARRSDGHSAGAGVRLPFFSLSSPYGGSVGWSLFDGRVLRYERGIRNRADSAHRKFAQLRADGALALRASQSGYVRVGLTGQVRRDDLGQQGSSIALPRTITVAAGAYVSMSRPRFIQVQNFASMGRDEDIALGGSLRADVMAAPAAWGFDRDGVGARLGGSIGFSMPAGFTQVGASVGGLRSSAGVDSSSAEGSLLSVVQPNDRHLLVAHASAGRLKNSPFGVDYDLGLGYGVRAFPSHSFTGDRYFLLNGEYRWLAVPRFLGLVGLGVAGFIDHGGAWFTDDPKRTGTDAGVGIRIGSIRSAGSIIGRLDFAYRFEGDREPAGWVVSLGRGFAWQRF